MSALSKQFRETIELYSGDGYEEKEPFEEYGYKGLYDEILNHEYDQMRLYDDLEIHNDHEYQKNCTNYSSHEIFYRDNRNDPITDFPYFYVEMLDYHTETYMDNGFWD